MAFVNLFTAGIVVSAAYRAGHALGAFISDVKMSKKELTELKASMAAIRADMIKFGLLAGGAYMLARGLGEVAKKGEDLESVLTNIQLITQSNTKSMSEFTRQISVASARTKYSMVDVGTQSQQFLLSVQRLLGEEGFKKIIQPVQTPVGKYSVAQAVSESATVLELMPGKKYKPEATVEAMGALVNMFAAEATPEKMMQTIREGTLSLIFGPFQDPNKLVRALGFMQGTGVQMPLLEQSALISTLSARGVMQGRSASVAGRSIEEIFKVLFGKPEIPIQRGGGGPFSRRSSSDQGMSPANQRIAYFREKMGLNELMQQLMSEQAQGKPLGGDFIPRVLETITKNAQSISPIEWNKLMQGFTSQARRVIAQLRDPTINLAGDFNQLHEYLQKLNQTDFTAIFVNASLSTMRGAREAYESNVEDISILAGYQFRDGMSMYYRALAEGTTAIRDYMITHETATAVLIQSTGLMLAAATPVAGFKLGGAVGDFLLAAVARKWIVGAGASGIASALGIAAPWLGAAVMLPSALKLAAPAAASVGNWITGRDPATEMDKITQDLRKFSPQAALAYEGLKAGNISPAQFKSIASTEEMKKTLGEAHFNALQQAASEIPGFADASKIPASVPGTIGTENEVPFGSSFYQEEVSFGKFLLMTRDGMVDVTDAFNSVGVAGYKAEGGLMAVAKAANEEARKKEQETYKSSLNYYYKGMFVGPPAPKYSSIYDPYSPDGKKDVRVNEPLGPATTLLEKIYELISFYVEPGDPNLEPRGIYPAPRLGAMGEPIPFSYMPNPTPTPKPGNDYDADHHHSNSKPVTLGFGRKATDRLSGTLEETRRSDRVIGSRNTQQGVGGTLSTGTVTRSIPGGN